MADIIRMDMTVNDRAALVGLKKLAGGLKEMTDEEKKTVKEARELEKAHRKLGREGKRIWEQSRTVAQRYRHELQSLRQAKKMNILTEKQHAQAVSHTRQQMRMAGDAGRRAFGPQALSMAKGLAASLGMGMGVAGAVQMVNRGYETWLQNTREVITETKKASNEIISFAALQAGGTKRKRVMQAADLAVKYGISDRAQAYTTVQALQSAHGGDFAKGMEAAETVFAGTQVGIPVESGRELEVLGASQGQKPGQAIRMGFVAGEESARDPKTLATAGAGIGFWEDKLLGWAAAGVLAGSVKEGELNTYVKRGGIGLSKVGGLQDYFEKEGMADSGKLERLKYLAGKGIDNPEKLKTIGLNEIREAQAIATLVSNVGNVERISSAIEAKATPGILGRKRADVEAELPETRLQRESDQLKTLYRNEQAFGPAAERAMSVDIRERARGVVAQRLELRQDVFGADFIDEEGRTTGRAVALARTKETGLGLDPRTAAYEWLASKFGFTGDYDPRREEKLNQLEPLTEQILQELRSMNGTMQQQDQQTQQPTLEPAAVLDLTGAHIIDR